MDRTRTAESALSGCLPFVIGETPQYTPHNMCDVAGLQGPFRICLFYSILKTSDLMDDVGSPWSLYRRTVFPPRGLDLVRKTWGGRRKELRMILATPRDHPRHCPVLSAG